MKKFLSIILAVALVVTIVPFPRTFAAEANASVDASNFFVFTNESHGLDADTNFHLMKHTLDTHVEGVGDPWAFVNLRTGNSYGTTETAFNWTMNVGDSFPIYNPGSATSGYTTAAIAFELVFDTAGTFNPVITYIGEESSPKFDFYLVDATKETKEWYATPKTDGTSYQLNDSYFYSDCVTNLSSSDYLGMVDMYGDGSVDTATLPARTVKAQSYYLVVIPNGYNANMVKLEQNSSKFCTAKIKSFAMAPRPELTEAENTLKYIFNTYSLDTANLPNFDSLNSITYTFKDGTTVYGLRSKNLLHYFAFASWKSTYNYRIKDSGETELYTVYKYNADGSVQSQTEYDIPLVEECDPYPTMLLSKTDPWQVENNAVIQMVSARLDNGSLNSTLKTSSYKNAGSTRAHVMFRINVPNAGKYDLALTNLATEYSYGTITDVYFTKAPVSDCTVSKLDSYIAAAQKLGTWDSRTKKTDEYKGTVDVPVAGEYLLIFDTKNGLTYNSTTYNTYQTANGGTTAKSDYQCFGVSSLKLIPVEDTELEAVQKEHDAIASANNALVTYEEEAGVAKSTTTVNALAAYIDGTEIDSDIIDIASATVGGECTVTAPEKTGYTFLYWAKGASDKKMIISRDAEYSFVPHTDAINLIAVYEKGEAAPAAKAEFYNANGVLIDTLNANGKAPALPSMAGFGPATHWALYGSDKEYAADEDITLDGTMIFVASYGDKQKVNLTVTGGTASNTNPEYGEVVTVTATERSGSQVFNYWERDGKVVSFDREYTFKAWENTTLTAVYKDYKPSLAKEFRRIILKDFLVGDETAVMAEFIGFEDAIEKGIMFGDVKRSPMSTDDTQYSIINDLGLTATGYAILSDGTIITDK